MDLAHNFRPLTPGDPGHERYGQAKPDWLFEIDVWPHLPDIPGRSVTILLKTPVINEHGMPEGGWDAFLVEPSTPVRPIAALTGHGIEVSTFDMYTLQRTSAARSESDKKAGKFTLRGTAHQYAESWAFVALHSVVESVSFDVFAVGPEGEFEQGDSGYELDPRGVAPTEVHETAERFGTFDAEGDDGFRSESEDLDRGGDEITRYLQIADLDGESLATFSDWGTRPYPLLEPHSYPAGLQIMASRGYYLFSFWEEAEEVRRLVKAKGFSHLISPIHWFGRLVLESRDPWVLLILQDLLLASDLEGSEQTFLPTDRTGAPIELPFDVVEVETDYGFTVQLLRQTTASVKARLLR